MAQVKLGHVVGPGVPTGGTANQVLVKNGATNFDTSWKDASQLPAIGDEETAREAADAALADGLAIIANGDTHAAVAAEQAVYVRSHSTLAPGLYWANSAIGTNAALSTSNLTADSQGGLNKLKGDIDSLNSNVTNIDHKNVFTYVVAFNKTQTSQGNWTDGGITFPVSPGDRVTMDVMATGTGKMTRSATGSSEHRYYNDDTNISNCEHGMRFMAFTVLSGDESITISSYANSAITVRTAVITVVSKY